MNTIKIQLKSGETLSDYKDHEYDFGRNGLPTGIINKRYTGIGATHCEIVSKRNSIIVSPTRSLARSKYEEWVEKEEKEGIDCFYLGGGFGESKDSDLLKFLKRKGHKKVFAVADSFPRIIEVGGKDIYKEFSLVVDEIDTFQQDTSFRSSLEFAVDYFWDFEKKTVVTATMIEFSDERFKPTKDFPLFEVEIPDYQKRNLNYYLVVDSVLAVANLINQLQIEDKKKKIFVALNSIIYINQIIKTLVNEEGYDLSEFGVLCSEKSIMSILSGVERIELKKGILSKKITFATSAYFVGVDILEPVHLVVCNSKKNHYSIIFPEKIQQIIGRCRKGSHSLNLVTFSKLDNPFIKNNFPYVSKIQFIERLEPFKKTLGDIQENFKDSKVEDKESIEEKLLEVEISGIKGLLRKDVFGKIALSDFTVDFSVYNSKRIREYSEGITPLKEYLSTYFELKKSEIFVSQFTELTKLSPGDFVESFLSNYQSGILKSATFFPGANFSLICLFEAEANISRPKTASFLLQVIYFSYLAGENEVDDKIREYNEKITQIKPFARKIKLFKLNNSKYFIKKVLPNFKINQEYSVDEIHLLFFKLKTLKAKKGEAHLSDFINDETLGKTQLFAEFIETIFHLEKRRVGKVKKTSYKILSFISDEFNPKMELTNQNSRYKIDELLGVDDKSILLNVSGKLLDSMIK